MALVKTLGRLLNILSILPDLNIHPYLSVHCECLLKLHRATASLVHCLAVLLLVRRRMDVGREQGSNKKALPAGSLTPTPTWSQLGASLTFRCWGH
jgi:hypothetical protein